MRIAGQVPMVRANEWLDFVARYAGVEVGAALSAPSSDPSLSLVIEELQVDSLVVLEQEMHDVVFKLVPDPREWRLSMATDWLQARLAWPMQGGVSTLLIDRFDLVTGMRTAFAPIGIGERANIQWIHSTGGELVVLVKRGGKRNKGKLEERAGNVTGEGRMFVAVAPDASAAAIVEIQCESAPVATSESLKELADLLAKEELASGAATDPRPTHRR